LSFFIFHFTFTSSISAWELNYFLISKKKKMTNSKDKTSISRRRFIASSALVAAGLTTNSGSVIGAPNILRFYGQKGSLIKGVQIGVITYSYRSMPDQSAEATLKYVLDSGISAIELMGGPAENYAGMPENPVDRRVFFGMRRKARNDELTTSEQKEYEEMQAAMDAFDKEVIDWRSKVSMDKFEEVKRMYAEAEVSIYAFKPNAFGTRNTDAEIDYGFRAAKALGATHVTLELPGDDAHTKKLGEFGKKYKIYIGYHGHEQQTPTWWDTALGQSEYNAMNMDIGHYVAAGNPSPLKLLKQKHDRIASMHIKDRQNPKNGKKNLPWGEGDTPIIDALKLMSKKKYTFPATVELEYKIPEDSDPVKEVKKCVEFCRNGLGG
jgi:sugar phosphate isomerase/epimerase